MESTGPDTLDIRTADGRLRIRFTDTTFRETDPGPGEPALDATAPEGLWRILGLSDSALVPLSRCDLTTSDLVALARTCLTLNQAHSFLPQPGFLPDTGPLLERLATTTQAFDNSLPDAPDIDEAFSRAELLLLAEAALALHQAHGDPDKLLSRPELLLLAHLAYDNTSA
ncbi:hypothetical protein [Streptomyces clavuligerus]|uniref:hypothetical protein n=1 Tax=Streptomyces clavuligerus TaxID=1901 RepID=UPI00020D920B|nr:hypothetical protein [Streptomyces clavuligerus]WDN55913.1 hypothetical protein LL058_28875 [Streptomyces clavuligerus]